MNPMNLETPEYKEQPKSRKQTLVSLIARFGASEAV